MRGELRGGVLGGNEAGMVVMIFLIGKMFGIFSLPLSRSVLLPWSAQPLDVIRIRSRVKLIFPEQQHKFRRLWTPQSSLRIANIKRSSHAFCFLFCFSQLLLLILSVSSVRCQGAIARRSLPLTARTSVSRNGKTFSFLFSFAESFVLFVEDGNSHHQSRSVFQQFQTLRCKLKLSSARDCHQATSFPLRFRVFVLRE